mmetsp:Transcript_17887/g.59929  ORF Transcript_17887/g.59929 Transcript_17887/m.59929 type:complete len:364 (+) Transcript_17887:222-1313(+)
MPTGTRASARARDLCAARLARPALARALRRRRGPSLRGPQGPVQEGVEPPEHGPGIVQHACADQGVVQELLGHHAREGLVRGARGVQFADDGVRGVHLEGLLGQLRGLGLLEHLHEAAHGGALPLLVDHRGGVYEARGHLHLGDAPLERAVLQPPGQVRRLLLGERALCGGVLWEGQVRGGGAHEALARVLARVLHHKVVDLLVAVEHLEAALAEHLHVSRGLRGRARGGHQVVDGVPLVGPHAGHVLVHGGELPGAQGGGLVPEELHDLLLVGEVRAHPFLKKLLKVPVKVLVGGLVLLALLGEELEEPGGEHAIHAPEERRVLHGLPGDVERDVLRVHHAHHEAHPRGQERVALWRDEHLA